MPEKEQESVLDAARRVVAEMTVEKATAEMHNSARSRAVEAQRGLPPETLAAHTNVSADNVALVDLYRRSGYLVDEVPLAHIKYPEGKPEAETPLYAVYKTPEVEEITREEFETAHMQGIYLRDSFRPSRYHPTRLDDMAAHLGEELLPRLAENDTTVELPQPDGSIHQIDLEEFPHFHEKYVEPLREADFCLWDLSPEEDLER